jgi:hypothetical protein
MLMEERSWLAILSGGSTWVLVRRLAAASAALLFLVMVLGCMSLQFGGGTREVVHSDDSAYAQTGKVRVPVGKEVQVYYPVAYVSPPNLEMESPFDDSMIITEQKGDHFLVKNIGSLDRRVEWTARGVKAPQAAVVAAPTPAQSPPATLPALPAQPLPAGSTPPVGPPSPGSAPPLSPVTPLARQ